MSSIVKNLVFLLLAFLSIAVAAYHLEDARKGVDTQTLNVGSTPATRYRLIGTDGPMVVVAHGFAGSRQLMQAYSLTLARAGYDVLAFDFEGHGRNPIPMSGDVTAIDGTTRLLVEETRRVIAAARELKQESTGITADIALLGHSMATDVLLRAAILEADAGSPVATMVGISMFSEAITQQVPPSLLIINGEWESRLRAPALAQLQLLDAQAQEGDTVSRDDVVRRVIAAPYVEHVSVLYSEVALQETRDWMDMTFERHSDGEVLRIGGWILLMLVGIVLLFKPLTHFLPVSPLVLTDVSTRMFWLATLLPAVVVPTIALLPAVEFLPVLVADYLMLHLALYGALQLLILRPMLSVSMSTVTVGAISLAVWGIAVFGVALDRYAASFLPTSGRLSIIGVLCLGAIVFMVADSVITHAGRGRLWRRVVARVALISSLGIAAAIDPERLIFLLLILPVLILFYLVHGLMGRWVAQRCGPLAAGIGLGLALAWAIGVSFPLFDVSI